MSTDIAATIETIGSAYPIKVSKIKPNPDQPRKFFDQEKLQALATSIQQGGQESPISVVADPHTKGTFIILDGERRWRAHGIIWDRTGVEPTINAFLSVIKDKREFYRRSVIANLHREDLTDLEEAEAVVQLFNDGMTNEAIATLLDKSMSYVRGRRKLHSLPQQVKDLMSPELPRNERLTATTAIDIAMSVRDDAMRIELAMEAVRRNLDVVDTRALINRRMGVTTETRPTTPFYSHTQHMSKELRKMRQLLAGRILADKILDFDIEKIYNERVNGKEERAADEIKLSNMIVSLRALHAKVRGDK